MGQRKTLTQRQVDVLRWVGDGCPVGVMVGEGHYERITVGALRNRGLVRTRGKGRTWSAEITPAGVAYLARVDGPTPPLLREPNRQRGLGLVEEVIAAGGVLRVPRPGFNAPVGSPNYELRVASAERRGVVPVGKRLVVTRSRGDLVIELCDVPEGTPTVALPVSVPGRVGRYHHVVSKFRDTRERLEVSRAQLQRVSRILQGLVVESERRGYEVDMASMAPGLRTAWRGGSDGHLVITIEGVAIAVRVNEKGVKARGYQGGSRSAAGGYPIEDGATGVLVMAIVSPHSQSRRISSWADGAERSLEEHLPAVLMEAETRSAEVREGLRLAREAAERRRGEWEEAMAKARVRYTEHLRAQRLEAQVDGWQRAGEIRAYCAAIEQARPGDPGAVRWVVWARAYADRIDPLNAVLDLPEVPDELAAGDLQPFLEGWSAHGPDKPRGWS